MPRNLVLCFDGTNNEFGPQNTSVVRLVQSLHRHPSTQRLYYDPGVGTLPEPGVWSKLGKAVSTAYGLAFGTGLTWKVEQAYSYLMDFWERGDRVFIFGFSRGAYAARVLAGMLHGLGLLPRGSHNMVPYAMRLFKAIRNYSPSDERAQADKYWRLCDEFRWTFARPTQDGDEQRRFRVHFLGLWDTVSSVSWVWDPAKFQFTAHNPSVNIVRHAVSVDERRWFFRQNLMQHSGDQDLEERWFPGVHSDVGGGYAEKYTESPLTYSRLWRPPLDWMIGEGRRAGLLVDEQRLARVLSSSPASFTPWTDPQHESLHGPWWLAEIFPKWRWNYQSRSRALSIGRGGYRNIPLGALIDNSTLQRLRTNKYAPPNLSERFVARVRDLKEVPDFLPYAP